MNAGVVPLVLGTRASPLALAQAQLVVDALAAALPGVQIRIEKIKTTGDHRLDVDLATGSGEDGVKLDKGLFTKELEVALLEHRIDAAVHSLKDLPGEMPPALVFGAILPRGASSDVLVSCHDGGLDALPQGATVATSSERRRRQLLDRRPDLAIAQVRGNVGTRLGKLRQTAGWDALLLARAGLERLGFDLAGGTLGEPALFVTDAADWMLPAAGQGAIAVQIRAADAGPASMVGAIHHPPTALAVRAERALLRLVGGGCHSPVGVRAEISGERLRLRAAVFYGDDTAPRRAASEGDASAPELVAESLYAKLDEYNCSGGPRSPSAVGSALVIPGARTRPDVGSHRKNPVIKP